MTEPEGALALDLAGETLWLLPQRALCWPARRTLVVADLHFGKDDVFRRAGLAIPEGAAAEDLARLDALLLATRSERLLVLGDFLHGDLQPGDAFPPRFAAWRATHRELAIVVVAGNHDRHARRDGAPPAALEVQWATDPLREAPFHFTHDPGAVAGSATGGRGARRVPRRGPPASGRVAAGARRPEAARAGVLATSRRAGTAGLRAPDRRPARAAGARRAAAGGRTRARDPVARHCDLASLRARPSSVAGCVTMTSQVMDPPPALRQSGRHDISGRQSRRRVGAGSRPRAAR